MDSKDNSQSGVMWLIDEVHYLGRVILSSSTRFYWDNGFSKAASLAYTSLLSLIPALALAFGIFASFSASAQYERGAMELLFRQFFPSLWDGPNAVNQELLNYLSEVSHSISSISGLALFFLLLTSILLINSVEYILNEIWQVFTPRSITQRIQIFSAILLTFPVLLFSVAYLLDSYLRVVPEASYISAIAARVLPLSIDIAAFLALYYLVPKAPVRFRSALFGAVLSGLLFGLLKWGFAIYILRFSSYGRIYGAMAAVPVFLFWLYLVWIIVLLGAECCYQAQYLPRRGRLWKRSIMEMGDGSVLLALQALTFICQTYQSGENLPDDLEIAEALGCSTVLMKPALDSLEHAGIISRGGARSAPLALARSPEKIKLSDILRHLSPSGEAVRFPAEMAKAFALFEQQPDEATLADVINLKSA